MLKKEFKESPAVQFPQVVLVSGPIVGNLLILLAMVAGASPLKVTALIRVCWRC